MQVQELTPNGVEKLLNGQPAILQVVAIKANPVQHKKQSMDIIIATISDGFAYYQTIYLFPDAFNSMNPLFCVLRLKLTEMGVRKFKKGKSTDPLLTDSSSVTIFTRKIGKKIGDPISYEEFVKNGKKNSKGSRKIADTVEINTENEDEDTNDQLFREAQKLRQKIKQNVQNVQNNPPQKKQQSLQKSKPRQPSNYGDNSNKNNKSSNSVSVSIATKSNNYPQQSSTNPHTNNVPKQKPKPNQPILKQSQPQAQHRNSIKPQVKHHQDKNQKIKQLFLGLQNFKLLARLIFVWPIKMITNKKGNQSQLLNLQFADQSGTIMCTIFGDNANRYSGIQIDQNYSITGAYITQASYKGITQLKLNFNDNTKLSLVQQPNSIPKIDRICLSLKQLTETQKGRVVSVICMLKQTQLVEFVSKNGNKIKKKLLKMYDFDNQIECDLTLFNDKAQINYPSGMYALKGIQVDQFQGLKQFKCSLVFLARQLHNHPLNKQANLTEQLTFVNINQNKKPKKQSLSSFSELTRKCAELRTGQSIWSQILCYFKSVRLGGNTKNIYLSCPACKKKIHDQTSTYCQNCNKDIGKPMYRYILNVNLVDDHDNIWASAYDEAGQAVMTIDEEYPFTADMFADFNQEQVRQKIQEIRYRHLKVKIVSSKEMYNNEDRIKHKIIKVLPLDYVEESKILLEKIKTECGDL